MQLIHYANTDFEDEWSSKSTSHPLHQILELIPCLYAKPDEKILIKNKTSLQSDVRMVLSIDGIKTPKLDYWGLTPSVAEVLKQIKQPHPPLAVVKEISSKEFCLKYQSEKDACLVFSYTQFLHWKKSVPGQIVLKRLHGVAGRGHEMREHCFEKFIKEHAPVIAQKWWPRITDFSTQWMLSEKKEIRFLGSCLMKNTQKGGFKEVCVNTRFALDSILETHQEALSQLSSLGYFGPVGIDGLFYGNPANPKAIPILEINPRKTMGWLTLKMQELLHKPTGVRFRNVPSLHALAKTPLLKEFEGKHIEIFEAF